MPRDSIQSRRGLPTRHVPGEFGRDGGPSRGAGAVEIVECDWSHAASNLTAPSIVCDVCQAAVEQARIIVCDRDWRNPNADGYRVVVQCHGATAARFIAQRHISRPADVQLTAEQWRPFRDRSTNQVILDRVLATVDLPECFACHQPASELRVEPYRARNNLRDVTYRVRVDCHGLVLWDRAARGGELGRRYFPTGGIAMPSVQSWPPPTQEVLDRAAREAQGVLARLPPMPAPPTRLARDVPRDAPTLATDGARRILLDEE